MNLRALLMGALLLCWVLPAGMAQERVPETYFGMHIQNAEKGTPWPNVPFGAWRLWDSGVAWPDLEPRRGEWHFERLDGYVALAHQHHVRILLTLGLTPEWASARPAEKSDYKPGNAAEPKRMHDWQDYVRTVATRYRGRIESYEIWNEPNRKDDFSGSAAILAQMTRQAYRIIKHADPSAMVVSASPTASNGLQWFSQYLAYGAARYADVVGYHLYVNPLPPEEMVKLSAAVERVMKQYGVGDKPLWDTETGWAKPKVFRSEEEQAAFVSRTYIVNWPTHVRRVYWYAWDNHVWVTLEMMNAKSHTPTRAAQAYAVTYLWLVGAVMKPCQGHPDGTWICSLQRARGPAWIIWNVNATTDFSIPAAWQVHTAWDVMGKERPVNGPTTAIGNSPVLLLR